MWSHRRGATRRPNARCCGGVGHGRGDGASRSRRCGRLVAGPRRPRPSPPEDHRPLRGRRAADGRQRPRPGDRLERLHLQLQESAPRADRARLPLLLDQRHRGAAEGLPPLGRPVRRPALRDVRIRHRRAGQRPGAAWPRPARHQAAVHHRGCAPRPVRLVAARAGGRRRRRHPHRPGGAAPLPHLSFGGSAAPDDPARCVQDPARHTRRDRTGRPPHHHHVLGSGLQSTRRPPRLVRKGLGRRRFGRRCGWRWTAAWSPTCRWAAFCRVGSTPA